MFWDPPRLPGRDVPMPDVQAEGVADLSERSARLDYGADYETSWSKGIGAHQAWIDDPHWILDALAGVDDRASLAGEDFVRGFLSTRYTFVADLKAAQAAAPGRFELPPHGRVERPTIRGEAWVDGDGLVRQVNWRQPFRRRPRLPVAKEPVMTIWHSVELWDFGVPVEIEVPAALETPRRGNRPA
jgi:hypothetical protein